jgi:cation diffusion facilitator family transporter
MIGRLLRPHSHDPADSIDTALQTSREGMSALKTSLAVLAVTASAQLIIVALSGSVALLADSIHNFADALTAIPLGLAFWLGRRPASRRYTYGFGRAEDLAGIFIILVVAATAAVAGWQAVDRLVHPQTVTHIGWVMAAGVVGFAGNEVVARHRIRVGRSIGSAALEADGYHARTDGVTSLGVVAGAIGVALGWRAADPIFGLVITVAILFVVKNAARDIYRRLMDAVDPALVDQIETVLGTTPGILAVDGVRVRWVGHQLHAEVEVTSDADLSLEAAHTIAEEARHHLLHQVRRLSSITIHSSPSSRHGGDPHALTSHHFNPLGTGTAQ